MSKDLILRINCSLYSVEQLYEITEMFKKYFINVSIADINHQKTIIQNMIDSGKIIISLDKFIPTSYNIDCSRVHNIYGKYLYHNIKFNPRLIQNSHIILYDHDVIGGIGFNMVKTLLEQQNNTVESFSFYNSSNYDKHKTELLDFADFVPIQYGGSGLVIENSFTSKLERRIYQSNEDILFKKASIPYIQSYEFQNDIYKLLYHLKLYGVPTIEYT